jgi:hypothetical protein
MIILPDSGQDILTIKSWYFMVVTNKKLYLLTTLLVHFE